MNLQGDLREFKHHMHRAESENTRAAVLFFKSDDTTPYSPRTTVIIMFFCTCWTVFVDTCVNNT